MDFGAISATLKDSFEVEIIHPATGEGGWFFELASPHHAGAQAKVAAILDRSKKRKFSTTSQDEQDGLDLVMARILSWRGLTSGGEEVPYSDEACMAILKDKKSFWVRTQLIDGLGDTARPFKS
jgi:hypothetical protein